MVQLDVYRTFLALSSQTLTEAQGLIACSNRAGPYTPSDKARCRAGLPALLFSHTRSHIAIALIKYPATSMQLTISYNYTSVFLKRHVYAKLHVS